MGQPQKLEHTQGGDVRRRRKKGKGRIPESIMTKDYLNQCQTANCRSRKHREHQAGKESSNLYHLTIKVHKIKGKEKRWKKPQEEKGLTEEQRQELHLTSQKACKPEER